MLKFALKRLLLIIPTLLGVVFIVFAIMSMTPSSPGRMILGQGATPEAVKQLDHELGYDKPFLLRFVDYVGGLLRGDFGNSYATKQPVLRDIAAKLPYTFQLGLLSMIVSSVIGISLGVLSAVRQYSLADTFSTVLAILFSSIPSFWLGMMLMLFFSVQFKLLPATGVDTWKNFVMPVATLGLTGSASLLRLTRTTMLEAIRQDYIKTARAKGAGEGRIVWKHALKNAILPVITVLGTGFGKVLSGAVITETVFSMPGVGTHVINAIQTKDIPVVLASTVILSAFFCVVMVIVDLLYAVVDPRVRNRFAM